MRRKASELEKGAGVPVYVALVIAVIFSLFPIYWMVATSLKPATDWLTFPPVWIPSELYMTNYMVLFTEEALMGGFVGRLPTALKAITDSVIVACSGTALAVVIGMLAAFAISRHKVASWIPIYILSARMAPPIVVMIPLVILYSTIGLIDTYQGLILAYALFTVPYAVWMIKSFIDDIPQELEDAAMIDGLSRLGAHFKVTLPLIKGGVAATALFLLILNWSEFLFALTLTHGRVVTIPVQAANYFSGTAGILYGPQSALGIVAVIPLIIFGYTIQKYLIRGLTFGAIKR